MTRRSFLALSAGAAAWAACGRDPAGPSPSPGPDQISLAKASVETAVGDKRLAVFLADADGPFAPDGASIVLAPSEGEGVTVEPIVERVELGLGGNRPSSAVHELLIIEHEFRQPGFWSADATFKKNGARGEASMTFEVLDDSTTPRVGEPALRTASPTTSDPRGVDPLCTRDPVCGLHEMTIEQAVTAGRPSVLLFATPLLCQSVTCGPALDIVEEGQRAAGDDVSFVHIEIYRTKEAAPGNVVEAVQEWAIPGEPWLVFVDAEGVVRGRWSGAFGPEGFAKGLEQLRAGTL